MALDDSLDVEENKNAAKLQRNSFSLHPCSSSLSKFRVCFDKFNKFVFCCVGKTVKIYSVSDGEFLHDLCHDSDVIAVSLNPNNTLQLITCTSDGEISLWNNEKDIKLKAWNVNKTVCNFLSCKKVDVLGFVTVWDEDIKSYNLYEVRLKENEVICKKIGKNAPRDSRKISCSYSGEFLAYSDEENLLIKSPDDKAKSASFLAAKNCQFTCVICHPSKDCIATGDDKGCITLWFNFFEKTPVTSNFHWHSNPVSDIAFSTEGSTMYSGGMECVAVKWHLQSSYKEESHECLARLGGHVTSLSASPDNQLFAVVLDDNRILIASSQMKISCTINSLVKNAWFSKDNRRLAPVCPAGLLFLPQNSKLLPDLKNGCLMTNGHPGELQLFDPTLDRQVFSLDVVERNLPPSEALTLTEVIHASSAGEWLVTVEFRKDEVYTGDFTLKFWRYDKIKQKLELNLSMENPHFKVITCMKFQPIKVEQNSIFGEDSLCLATASLDGKVKFWMLGERKDFQGSVKKTWLCESFLSYRNKPAYACQFNPSGKVLAVNFANLLTFWKFDDQHLLLSLTVADEGDYLKQIEFGAKKRESRLVCLLSNKNHCSVWNLDSQTKMWNFDCKVFCICLHNSSGLSVAFIKQTICYFDLSSGSILSSYSTPEGCEVLASCFADENLGEENLLKAEQLKTAENFLPTLYFLTGDQNLMRLCTKDQLALYDQRKCEKTLRTQKKPTNLKILLEAAKADLTKKSVDPIDARYLEQKANLEILNAPAHTLPGLEILGSNFIESCLQPKVLQTWSIETETNFMEVDTKNLGI